MQCGLLHESFLCRVFRRVLAVVRAITVIGEMHACTQDVVPRCAGERELATEPGEGGRCTVVAG